MQINIGLELEWANFVWSASILASLHQFVQTIYSQIFQSPLFGPNFDCLGQNRV